MYRHEPLRKGIHEFKTKCNDMPKYIVYECQYLKDLSNDIEADRKYVWGNPGPEPLVPENRKNSQLYGYPGYMRELGFYGFVIYGYKVKMFYHVKEGKSFFTKC